MLKEDDRKRGEKYQWTEDRIKAEEANQLKSAFLGTVSHELRTPLTVLRGNAQVGLALGDEDEREPGRAAQAGLHEALPRQRAALEDDLRQPVAEGAFRKLALITTAAAQPGATAEFALERQIAQIRIQLIGQQKGIAAGAAIMRQLPHRNFDIARAVIKFALIKLIKKIT